MASLLENIVWRLGLRIPHKEKGVLPKHRAQPLNGKVQGKEKRLASGKHRKNQENPLVLLQEVPKKRKKHRNVQSVLLRAEKRLDPRKSSRDIS